MEVVMEASGEGQTVNVSFMAGQGSSTREEAKFFLIEGIEFLEKLGVTDLFSGLGILTSFEGVKVPDEDKLLGGTKSKLMTGAELLGQCDEFLGEGLKFFWKEGESSVLVWVEL